MRFEVIAGAALVCAAALGSGRETERVVVFNDDGGWSWFQDERAIVDQGRLIIGSVAAGVSDPARRGDIEVTSYDLASGAITRAELHDQLASGKSAYDDHNSPALLVRPDGRLLAVYSKHGPENRFYCRVTERPHEGRSWRPERPFVPSETSRITYSNLHRLSREGRIYNFFRGLDNSFKPSYAWSEDEGESWKAGNVYIDVPTRFKHRPYVKYASNGADTVHMFYTDGHPRNFDNSAHHIFYRGGKLHTSDGKVIRGLAEGLKQPEEGTRVFQGDANNVAWVSDIHLDGAGRPYVAYSVQKDSAGIPPRQGGEDHRYRYARWDGSKWQDFEIAHAGRRLYPGEDDYTGNIALDPQDPNTVYISVDVDPRTGQPLASAADHKRHYEIFRGATHDGGRSWAWTPLTRNSSADNIRPIVPVWKSDQVAVIWLRGTYRAYTDYDLDVVGVIRSRK
ncbi:MAG: BNR-4 repeat-containing protein [Acidobacteria bacterium]|nr:BNR-4 repeat-containing protein [Acidobacteriota bacterium]